MVPVTIRVCHLISDLDAGGAERTLVNLLTGLAADRFSSDVVSLTATGVMALPLEKAGIPVMSLNMPRGRPTLTGFMALVRHLRRTKPALLQTWLYHADLAGTIATCFVRVPGLVWNVRCSDATQTPGDASRWLTRALALMSLRPRAVIVNSDAGKLFHEALGYRPRQWVRIANGVSIERFRPRPSERGALRARFGLDAGARLVGFVSRFHPMKDCRNFLGAAALVSRQLAEACFVLCGSRLAGDNSELKQLIDEFGLSGRAIVLGTRTDMEDIYPLFDVLALSSAYGEGFPNVLIEAMACGVPCVATDVGDSRAVLGEVGLIVPPRDPQALAHGLVAILNGGPWAMAERVRAHVVEHYAVERMCSRYQELYEHMVRSARSDHG
jgi:glycosyltransferase involved in cell wall biosynthesis